jgi:hypothetical protein
MFTEIDVQGTPSRVSCRDRGSSPKPNERFRSLIPWDHQCEASYGLIRSEIMRKTRLQLNYTDSDRTLLAELSLWGRFHQIPEPLFFKRIHPKMSTVVFSEWRQRMLWFDPSLKDKITFPHWMQFFHYLEIISRIPLPAGERLRCYGHMLYWLFPAHHARYMAKDLYLAVLKTIHKILPARPAVRKEDLP